MAIMWFIETWSPSDGIAFVTRRPGREFDDTWPGRDGYGNRLYSLAMAEQRFAMEEPLFEPDAAAPDPTLTVVLHPPYWDPVAISNPATALRALAHGYQHRLYDQEGEIAFATIEEVKEVVRRGYTGGGLGFSPGPAPGPEPAPDEGGPELPSLQLEGELHGEEGRMHWANVREALAVIETNRVDAFHRLESYVWHNERQILDYHRRVVSDYMPWFFSKRPQFQMPVPWRDALTWFSGFEPSLQALDALRTRVPLSDRTYELLRYFDYYRSLWWVSNDESSRAILNGMLFRIPLLTPWTKIKTLGDLLVAASTSRAFVRRLEARHFFLLLFIATLVVRAKGGVSRWRDDPERDLSAASRWLVDAMPGVLAPTHRAEALLDRLVE